MNEPQSAPYRHLRGPGALCQPPEIPAPAAPWRGPRDRILSFLYKWEDGSAQGLEAESFFTGEEKLNEKTRSLGSPFRRARHEAAPSTRMERLREVKRLSQVLINLQQKGTIAKLAPDWRLFPQHHDASSQKFKMRLVCSFT